MINLIYIAAGGAIGAVARYLVTELMHAMCGRSFPYGTLTVNIVGSFLIGLLSMLILQRLLAVEPMRLFLLTGILGAFTTFSTFSLETLNLFNEGKMLFAGMNITLNLLGCLVAVWFGVGLGRVIG